MEFFSIENTAFTLLAYSISYVELIGVIFGLISVYLATQANILTWPTGIFNEVFAFLYFSKSSFMQICFCKSIFSSLRFMVGIIGDPIPLQTRSQPIKPKHDCICSQVFCLEQCLQGISLANIHEILPAYFAEKASFPYIDSFIMVSSIFATVLLAKKKIENWYIWIFVDVIAVFLYLEKDVLFLSLEYLIFLGLATYGAYSWKKELIHD